MDCFAALAMTLEGRYFLATQDEIGALFAPCNH
jgi:hypothetical protein